MRPVAWQAVACRWLGPVMIAAAVALLAPSAPVAAQELEHRVREQLRVTPLIDGHNDLPWALRHHYAQDAYAVPIHRLDASTPHPLHTDLHRLRAGGVGGQFWSVFVDNSLPPGDAVLRTLEQIDLVKSMVRRHAGVLELATSAADVRRIHAQQRIAALLGVEGGHQMGGSLAVLRQFHALGVRYLTLTHARTTDWADSATDNPRHGGLAPFGHDVIRAMNRMGMMVDLSHVSPSVMDQALTTSTAPVIFSHSAARAVVDHPRNVPDSILRRLPENGGIVMVVFYPGYVSADYNEWVAARAAEQARLSSPPFSGLYIGQPERSQQAMAAWEAAHPKPVVTLLDVIQHIEHIRAVAGIDHVGLGSDFDGVGDLPRDLGGVDAYPALLAALMDRGWSEEDIAKLAGENLLRVMEQTRAVASSS